MSSRCTVRMMKPLRTKKNSTPAVPKENGTANAAMPKYFCAAKATPRWYRTTSSAATALPACNDLYTDGRYLYGSAASRKPSQKKLKASTTTKTGTTGSMSQG